MPLMFIVDIGFNCDANQQRVRSDLLLFFY